MTKLLCKIFLLVRYLFVSILFFCACPALAQQFSVTSVTLQKNDVSAFISPVRDLNGQACALLKVEASTDFAFSSPLGIVDRKDEVGEIHLYLPNGTKMITIKHPVWGVLRNYTFEKPLESHLCYLMKLRCPQPVSEVKKDTIVITRTLRDTIAVNVIKPKLPRSNFVIATASISNNGPLCGVMLSTLKRHGAFIHVSTNFTDIGATEISVDKHGMPSDGDVMPYYTNEKRYSNYILTAGLMHRVSNGINIFEGVGYGKSSVAWQLSQAEGGGYALVDDYNYRGVSSEVGALWHNRKWCVLLSASNIIFKQWQINIGVGIKFGVR